jgi:hypothetical protein
MNASDQLANKLELRSMVLRMLLTFMFKLRVSIATILLRITRYFSQAIKEKN